MDIEFNAPLFTAPALPALSPVPPAYAAPPEFTRPEPAPVAPGTNEPIERASIFTRAVCVQLALSRLGTRRKVDPDRVTAPRRLANEGEQAGPDSDLLHVSAEILKSPELEAIRKHDRETSELLRSKASGPALFKGGVYLIALELLEATDRQLNARLDERAALVETFTGAYLRRKTETEAKLGTLADSFTWPDLARVRASFDARIRYLMLDTPESLKGISSEIFERERAKAASEWAEALDECRQVLRSAFADLVGHLADRLAPGEDGKRKIFRDSLVRNFSEFVDTFNARNIADDAQLADLVNRARDVMAGVSASDLRDADALRRDVAAKMAAIKTAIDPLVTEKPSRQYNDEE